MSLGQDKNVGVRKKEEAKTCRKAHGYGPLGHTAHKTQGNRALFFFSLEALGLLSR